MNSFLFYLFLVPVIVIALLVLNLFFATSKPNEEKLTTFECGFSPVEQARQKFSVHFYLVGILFLVFDLEVLLLFPAALSMNSVGQIGFWILVFFLVVLTAGFWYEYLSGALNYTNKENDSKHPPCVSKLSNSGRLVRNFSSSSRNFAKPGKRLTNVERDSFSVTPNLHGVIIGSCLGDLYIRREKTNARLIFKQGIVHKDYIYHLFQIFSSYSNMEAPKHHESFDKRTSKTYTSIVFNTYSLPCFNFYHDLFYVDRVKRVPDNIGELLTPVGLAYWAMEDGTKVSSGFRFCTDSYTFEEVQLLIKVLKSNFDLNCTIHKMRKDQHRIYIKLDSMGQFRSIVTPHFHELMMYKLAVDTD